MWFSYHHLRRLRRLEVFPRENLLRDCLVQLHSAALDLWGWTRLTVGREALSDSHDLREDHHLVPIKR
jgi:hypothetical protein